MKHQQSRVKETKPQVGKDRNTKETVAVALFMNVECQNDLVCSVDI